MSEKRLESHDSEEEERGRNDFLNDLENNGNDALKDKKSSKKEKKAKKSKKSKRSSRSRSRSRSRSSKHRSRHDKDDDRDRDRDHDELEDASQRKRRKHDHESASQSRSRKSRSRSRERDRSRHRSRERRYSDDRHHSSRDYRDRDRDRSREKSRDYDRPPAYDRPAYDRPGYDHRDRRDRPPSGRGSAYDDEYYARHGSRSRRPSRERDQDSGSRKVKTSADQDAKPIDPPTTTVNDAPPKPTSKFSDIPPPAPVPVKSKFSDAPPAPAAAGTSTQDLPPKAPVAALRKTPPSQDPHRLPDQDPALPELTQGDLETAKSEADKLRRKMDDEMKARQEEKKKRLESWAKEKGLAASAAGPAEDSAAKAWNLEDDEDDEEDTATPSAPLPDMVIPILPAAVKEKGEEKRKRTAILGAKKVVKRNAIGFGLKSLTSSNPTPLLKPIRILLADEDDEEVDTGKGPSLENGKEVSAFASFLLKKEKEREEEGGEDEMQVDDGQDALDAFMKDVHVEVKAKSKQDKLALQSIKARPEEMARVLKDEVSGDEEEEEEEDPGNLLVTSAVEINQADIFAAAAAKAASKKKEMPVIDHSKVEYEAFRKDFYKEPPELSEMSKQELDQKRVDLGGIRVRGHNCPKPIEKWSQFGLPLGVLEVVKKVLKYEAPSPIQAQAIPAIMNGRDVIGIAKTGSGKTVAFLLPMFRHIKDQRPSQGQEGPIGLVMTPTRELALQIFKDCKSFAKPMGLRVACCYGGSPIRDQIAELKRGADIIICTPGRMIDLLCANGGRVTNLKRVTYLVLDEADRMFDMGFEPQVMKMVTNIRPDRQTVLFSATFPRFVEALVRKILTKPLEIIVGARSVVASDVTQIVQILPDEETKFLKLLGILGKTSDSDPSAKFLIFVDRQEAADTMMSNLMKRGYPCLSLHGGKDQADRDSVISDFKGNTTNILVATSVAARGLDVKDLKVVINYDCPNHLEDYVHRCGRTGRAGNKGTAYTFIKPDQSSYAVEIVKALTMSKANVPADLKVMADKQSEKVKLGFARIAGSGFGGRGLGRLEGDRDSIRRIQMVAHGVADAEEEKDEDKDGDEKKDDDSAQHTSNGNELVRATSVLTNVDVVKTAGSTEKVVEAAAERAKKLNSMLPHERARFLAQNITRLQQNQLPSRVQTDAACWAEVEINDYPQKARWKVTSKEQISKISASSNAAITSRGIYVAPGKQPPEGVRKLYLFIEADFQHCVERAKEEIKALLTEATMAAMEDKQTIGRYSVL